MMRMLLFALALLLPGAAWGQVQPGVSPLGGRILAHVNGLALDTQSATEFNLASVKIPAGSLGITSEVWVITYWSETGSANTKTATVRWSTTQGAISSGFLNMNQNITSASSSSALIAIGRNAGATNSQVGGLSNSGQPFGSNNAAAPTGSLATGTTDVYININGAVTNTADKLTLTGYLVLVYQ